MHYTVFVWMLVVTHSVSGIVFTTRHHARHVKYGYYIGCYIHGCLRSPYDIDDFNYHNSTTTTACTAVCRNHGYPLAAVYNQTRCSCACFQNCLPPAKLNDTQCGMPCPNDIRMFCGGANKISLYFVKSPYKAATVCRYNNNKALKFYELDSVKIAIVVGIPTTSLLLCLGSAILTSRRRGSVRLHHVYLSRRRRGRSNHSNGSHVIPRNRRGPSDQADVGPGTGPGLEAGADLSPVSDQRDATEHPATQMGTNVLCHDYATSFPASSPNVYSLCSSVFHDQKNEEEEEEEEWKEREQNEEQKDMSDNEVGYMIIS